MNFTAIIKNTTCKSGGAVLYSMFLILTKSMTSFETGTFLLYYYYYYLLSHLRCPCCLRYGSYNWSTDGSLLEGDNGPMGHWSFSPRTSLHFYLFWCDRRIWLIRLYPCCDIIPASTKSLAISYGWQTAELYHYVVQIDTKMLNNDGSSYSLIKRPYRISRCANWRHNLLEIPHIFYLFKNL